MEKNYWLLKSEPEVYSIADLKKDGKTVWDGVRNYQARNFLRDQIKTGDGVLFYHSNAEPSGIAGIAEVSRAGFPDANAFNAKSKYFDAASKKEVPIWYAVEIHFVKIFPVLLSLEFLKTVRGLENMLLLKKGQRLSVQPVTAAEWKTVLSISTAKVPA